MSDEKYNHPDHAEMEWHEVESGRASVEGWRCTRCHVMALPRKEDEVFDEHDCDDYKDIQEGISGNL